MAVEAAGVALVVAVIHVVFRLSAGFLFGVFDDDGVYVALGKSIAQGTGYHSIHLAAAPVQVRYPPGLPLVLAIPWALGGSLSAVRSAIDVLQVLVTAAGAGLIWWIGRRDCRISAWPLAICAVSPFVLDATIQFYNLPLTEPYLVLGWAAALALVTGEPSPGRAAAVGGILAATTLFRAAGIALVPAILIALALERRWRAVAACAATSLIPLAAWASLRAVWAAAAAPPPGTSSVVLPDDRGYWEWLGADGPVALAGYTARTMGANAVEYVLDLARYLVSIQAVGVIIVGAAILAAIAAGIRLRRTHAALVLTVLCVTVLTLSWPFAQARLFLPLLPFIGLLAANGVDAGVRRASPVMGWGVHGFLALMAMTVTLRQLELRSAAERAYQTGTLPPVADRSPTITLSFRSRFIFQVATWIGQHTTPQDRVMVQAPAGVFLYSGRRTVSAIPTESPLGPSVFEIPGRYLAERILTDSVTVVVWTPATVALGRDIESVQTRCPQVLARIPVTPEPPVYYRVNRDVDCLQSIALHSAPMVSILRRLGPGPGRQCRHSHS
ncbi:MAG TPA: hypothetical protein VH833_00195 [Gemmatimonadales bacterium]